MDEFWSHGRSAVSQYLEAAQVILLDFRELSQQIDHGRHQDSVTDAFAFNGLAEGLWTELRNCDLAGAESWGREHGGKVSDVENRRRVKIDSAFSISHPVVEVVTVRKDICVRQHDALRPAGCPACIDESENRFRIVMHLGMGIVPN